MNLKDLDPRGLIRESYRIEGITEGECRSIFLDWALGVPMDQSAQEWIGALHAHYAPLDPEHPMSAVLKLGLEKAKAPTRRGGRRARVSDED